MITHIKTIWLAACLAMTGAAALQAGAPANIVINAGNRQAVVSAYNNIYLPTLNVPIAWTHNVADLCDEGTTSQAFKDATIRSVNYFRAMAGLPGNVVLDPVHNARCQEAALMFTRNGLLDHSPPSSWTCYTEAGFLGANNSNVALGAFGPSAITGYMNDATIQVVGHRRWMLLPTQVAMGSGSTDNINGSYFGSDALWVGGPYGARPASPEFVAWPPPGYIPYGLVFDYWSFSIHEGQFTSAVVSMQQGGSAVSLTQFAPTFFIADNTLVWQPAGIIRQAGMTDAVYTITIQYHLGGLPKTTTYRVTIIDPSMAAPPGRTRGDFNNSGCTELADFLFLLDNWQSVIEGTVMGLDDFLNLVDNWRTGDTCA